MNETKPSPRQKAKDVSKSLLGLTMVPCLEDKLGDELADEELDALADRLEDAVEDEVAATVKEHREAEDHGS